MWDIISSYSMPGPKTAKWSKDGAPFTTAFGASLASYSDKQFPNFKNTTPAMSLNQTFGISTRVTVAESPLPQRVNNTINNNNNCCNGSTKKRRRRRKKKKKSKNNQNMTGTQQNKGEAPRTAGRQRHLSAAESEDSFIVFFEDEERCPSENDDTETEEFGSADSIIPRKKVRFVSDDKLCEVHPMVTWSFAYQAARRGPWEEYARDRDRFKRRIETSERVIGRVFEDKHRSRIFEERFARFGVFPVDHNICDNPD